MRKIHCIKIKLIYGIYRKAFDREALTVIIIKKYPNFNRENGWNITCLGAFNEVSLSVLTLQCFIIS